MKKFLRTLSIIMVFTLLIQIIPMSTIANAVQAPEANISSSVSESNIIGERTDLRDKFTKVFEREDGTYTAVVSSSPIHFDEDSEWKDIDNTLVESIVDGKVVLQNTDNAYSVSLPKSLTDKGETVKIEIDGYTISYAINNVSPPVLKGHVDAKLEKNKADTTASDVQKATKLEEKSAVLKYSSLQPDIDVEYTILPDSVKENIILNKKPSGNKQFSFTICAPRMTAKLLPDNTIEFCGAEGQLVFNLPAPFMLDANNLFSDDITVDFVQSTDGIYTLTYTPSKDWLHAKERIYPVVIDPVVNITVNDWYETICDTYVTNASGQQNVNHGSYMYATAGNKSDGSYWSYFRPSSMVTFWASKAVVTNATLKVYAKSETTQPMTITAYVVTSNWWESATFNGRPTNDSVPIDYAIAPANEYGQITFDITKAFPKNQDCVGGAVYPKGVMLGAFDSSVNSADIRTTEYTNTQYTPIIEYSYVETTGLSDKYEYHTHSAGRAGTVSINDFTGGMYIERDEIGIDGNIMPVSIKQYYSTATLDLANGCSSYFLNLYGGFEDYGRVWLTNYHRFVGFADDIFVDENGDSTDMYLYIDGTGEITYFVKTETAENGMEKWVEQYDKTRLAKGLLMWAPAEAASEEDFTGVTIEEPSGEKLTFDFAGRMVSITAAENEHVTTAPKIEISYKAINQHFFYEIENIIDGVGREYRFTYNTIGRLTAIQAYNTQGTAIKVGAIPNDVDLKISYTYEGNGYTMGTKGRLTSATYPDGQTVDYSYVTNHMGAPLIASITDINGYRLSYTYDGKMAVTQIEESTLNTSSTRVTGNVVDLTYNSSYQRTYEDSYNNLEVAQFDNYGRKIGTYNDEGQYKRTVYEDTKIGDTTYNLFSGSSYIQKQNDNLLVNSSFENGYTNWHIGQGNNFSPKITSSVKLTGDKSYKMTTNTNGSISLYQKVSNLVPGKYTLSAYVRIPDAVVCSPGATCGAKLYLNTTVLQGGVIDSASSGYIKHTGDGWSRLTVSINVTEAAPIVQAYVWLDNCTGTVYFDNIKLERADLETPYNVILNSKMTSATNNVPSRWTGMNLTSADIKTTQTKFDDTVSVMKITGNPTTQKSISQSFSVVGGKDDIIDIGCWAKANAATNSNAKFRIRAAYSYTDANNQTVNITETLNFISYVDYWQFVADSFTLQGACSNITIYLDYDNQINTAYFTDVRVAYTDVVTGGAASQSTTQDLPDPDNLLLNPGFENGDDYWELTSEASIDNSTTLSGLNSHKIACTSAGNYYSSQSIEGLVPSKYIFSICVNIPEAITATDAGARIQAITKDSNDVAVDTITSGYINSTNGNWQELIITVEMTTQAPNLEVRIYLSNAASTVYYDEGNLEYLRYEYSYDSMGNVLSTTINNTEKTMVTANSYTTDKNYLASTTNSADNMIQYGYNTGNGTLTSVTDSLNKTVGYTYNAMRALAGVSQAVSNLTTGAALTNSYGYEDDRLTGITAGNTVDYSFDYDLWGYQTEVSVGTQSLVEYNYGIGEDCGRVDSVTFGNGQTITYEYDDYNNVIGISYDGGTTYSYTYTYSSTNGLTVVTDNISNQITYFTDTGYEIYTIPQTGQSVLLYSSSYDDDDNFVQTVNGTTFTFADGAAETLDEADIRRTTGLTVKRSTISSTGTNLALSSSTDFFGRPVNKALGVKDGANNLGSVAVDVTYQNGTGDRTTEFISSYKNVITPTTGAATNVEYNYTYDANGNILADSLDNILKNSYVYDEAGQLVRVNDVVQNKTFVYTYDNGGNLTARKQYAYTTDTLGTVLQTSNYTYGDSNWKDKLTAFGSNALTYDEIGNLESFAFYTYTWTAGRQLESCLNGIMDWDIDFEYNADGLRTKKIINEVWSSTTRTYDYIWADGKLVSQTDGTDVLHFIYDDNGSPIAFIVNDTDEYLYIKNLQGDITGIADKNGAIIVNYTYNAWGAHTSITGSAANTLGALNPLRYRGYYYDFEIGLYYLQSRYYNPIFGRFINADDAQVLEATQGDVFNSNLVSYSKNNAVNLSDPTGYWSKGIHYGQDFKDFNSKGLPGTYEWAIDVGFKDFEAKSIAFYDANTDESSNNTSPLQRNFDAQKYHFNMYASDVKDTRSEISSQNLATAISEFKIKHYENAFKLLGEGLHAQQDIYAHGNFGSANIIKNEYEKLTVPHGLYHDNVQYDWKDSKYIDVVRTKNTKTEERYGIYGKVRIGNRYKATKISSKTYLRVFLYGRY